MILGERDAQHKAQREVARLLQKRPAPPTPVNPRKSKEDNMNKVKKIRKPIKKPLPGERTNETK